METVKTGWFVIYTKPRHEKKVAQYLKHLNFEYFLPTIRRLKILAKKKKHITSPLFPSYIFVKPDSVQRYIESMQLPGVLYYVKTGNQIAKVSEATIAKLQSLDKKNYQEDVEVSAEYFGKGNIINIDAGPFKGFDCEVIEHKGKYKVLVRLELLQRNIIVDIPSYCLASGFSHIDPIQYS